VKTPVDKKRVNSCGLKHLFLEGAQQQNKLPEKPENALLISRFQNFAADTAKKSPRLVRF